MKLGELNKTAISKAVEIIDMELFEKGTTSIRIFSATRPIYYEPKLINDNWECDCEAFRYYYNGTPCKHIVALLILLGQIDLEEARAYIGR